MNEDLKGLAKLAGKQILKKASTKVMAWVISGLVAIAPYILIGAGIIIIVFLILAPIVDVLNNWNQKKEDIVGFYEKYMNLLHFRGFQSNEEHFAKRIEKVYQRYLENGNLCVDVPLALATYYYPFDIAYNEEIYSLDLEELEEEDIAHLIWSEIKSLIIQTSESQIESATLRRKEKKVLNLLENMVSINKITYNCKYNKEDDKYEIDYEKEETIEEYKPSLILGTPFPQSDEECISRELKIYYYFLDLEKYDNYLRDEYINKANGFESDSLSEKEKNNIIDDIHMRAELYDYVMGDDERFKCGIYFDEDSSFYGPSPCGTYLENKLSDYNVLQYFISPVTPPFRLTSCIGYRVGYTDQNGVYHKSHNHCAFDIAIDGQDKYIRAAASGIILFSAKDSTGSNTVKIEHTFGDQKFYTSYLHLQNGSLLKRSGQEVEQGEKIGIQGSTGYSTGPHLHFAVAKDSLNGEVINPGELFLEGTTSNSRCRQQLAR